MEYIAKAFINASTINIFENDLKVISVSENPEAVIANFSEDWIKYNKSIVFRIKDKTFAIGDKAWSENTVKIPSEVFQEKGMLYVKALGLKDLEMKQTNYSLLQEIK